uniref:Senescence-specific cysteine protease SAG39-like n=1 Tax=Nelumbo nucifera TaxID=4432 RepID=A0A822Y1T2_NELNU|nr:TPA_asm: hypothetical protein HUJ06_026935 [Nelumbo nucifera]
MASLLIIILGASTSQANARTLQQASMLERFEQWMARHGVVYQDNVEKEKRFNIFKNNAERIDSFNLAGDRPYKQSINVFADRTDEELKHYRNGYINFAQQRPSSKFPHGRSFSYENVTDVPPSLDWREKGAVTPHQRPRPLCGSNRRELSKSRKANKFLLSEQQLVDCNTENNGCNGGWMDTAFQYIQQTGGINSEENYPYRGVQGMCDTEKSASHAASISGYVDVPSNDENALLKAVAMQPVSVAIDASSNDFLFYSTGVFTGECGTDLNHAVTVVGYGTSEEGMKYWLLKNSWGTQWGDKGYMRIQRDVAASNGGLCGIAMKASYPTA